MIGIYKFTNKINGHSYIGQSRNIEKRMKEHYYRAFNSYNENKEFSSPFYSALRKYGKENFYFEILEECQIKDLNEKEKYWIQYYDTFHNGYNATEGGDCSDMPHDGENHPKHKVTEQDVYFIREQYKNHILKDNVWNLFKDKIGKSGFNKIWNGATWQKVHMDVYTKENIAFHTLVRNSHPGKGNGKRLSYEQIKDIKQKLQTNSKEEVYEEYKSLFNSKQVFNNICDEKTYSFIKI